MCSPEKKSPKSSNVDSCAMQGGQQFRRVIAVRCHRRVSAMSLSIFCLLSVCFLSVLKLAEAIQ